MTFAIIDTNVLVSYFLSNKDSPPVAIINKIFDREITPIFNCYLIDEYRNVLLRREFDLNRSTVNSILDVIQTSGFGVESFDHTAALPDKKDAPIYELAILTRNDDSFLITGNVKHFPSDDFVVTPKEFMNILENKYRLSNEQFDSLNAEYKEDLSSAKDERDWIPINEAKKKYGGNK